MTQNKKVREELIKKFRYKFVTDSFMGLIMGKPRYIGNETQEVKDIEEFILQALQAERERVLDEVLREAGQTSHSVFCKARGKQFKKCIVCITDELRNKI